jgi:hypothetical protein
VGQDAQNSPSATLNRGFFVGSQPLLILTSQEHVGALINFININIYRI